MTDYASALAAEYPEYGYGIGYGLCYGSLSRTLFGHAPFKPTSEFYQNFQTYPPNIVEFGPATGDLVLGLDSARGALTEGTYSFGLATATFAAVDGDNDVDYAIADGVLSAQRNYFYDKIHIIPNDISLGVVASDRDVTVVVWNAFVTSVTASSILAYNATGITEDLSGTLSRSILALEIINWTFSIDADQGSSDISAVFRLFVDGLPYDISFLGSRSASFGFTHNWVDPLIETLSWKTSLVVTYNGAESRAALRDVARKTVEMTLYLDKHDVKRLENVMFKWQAKNLAVPMSQYKTQLTAGAVTGDVTLFLDPVKKGFFEGGGVTLINEVSKVSETLTVTSIPGTNDRIVLQNPIENDWSAGASIYPSAGARLKGNLPLVWQTQNFATGKATFEYDPARTDPLTPSAAAEDLYRGEEVLLQEPDWESGLAKDFSFEGGVIDNQTGVITLHETHTRPSRSTTFRWLLRGDDEIYNFRKFLYRRKGMAVCFWMSSWVNDFESITRTYNLGDSAFRFIDNGFYLNSAGKVERQHLQLQLKSGVVLRRKITGVSSITAGSVSELTLDSAYGVNFSSTDVVRASILSRYRLGTDEVSLEWLHLKLVRVTLPLVTVPDYLAQDAL